MNKLTICACVVVIALQLHSASAANFCPPGVRGLISETMRAADIHREILEGTYDYKMTQPGEEAWHQHWQQVHMDTAVALAQLTIGCK